MCVTKGWYSGKYDSTKQQQVMSSVSGILKYKTSIRFEMLLSGMVVITDAQWYDGAFFANMATNDDNEFDDFVSFLQDGFSHESAPLVIRRRNDYMSMFKKPFLFSSITNSDLRDFVLKIWDNNENKKEEKCCDMRTFLEFIWEELSNSKFKSDSYVLSAFNKFRNGIEKLDEVDERLFTPWGKTEFITKNINEIKDKLIEMLNDINASDEQAAFYIDEIKNELDKSYPNRSQLKSDLTKLCDAFCCDSFGEKFMHIFDDAYNRAIAQQHNCRYYDLYDAAANSAYNKETDSSTYLDTQQFPNEIIDCLGKISWLEFGEIFYDELVTKKRKTWLEAFDNQNIDYAKKSFCDYLDCIMKKITGLNIWLFNNSIFYRRTGTKRFLITIDTINRMVSGASSDSMIDSDEICLFFNGGFKDIEERTIVRYASTNDANNLFGTVFAPIEAVIKQ